MDAFRVSDRIIGIVVGAAAIGYLAIAVGIPEFALATVPIQSRTFPLGLGALMLILAVVLVARPTESVGASVAAGDGGPDPSEQPQRRFTDPRIEIAMLVASVAVYIAVFEPVGFVIATAVYLLAMNWYFGFKRPVVAVVIALVLTVAIQLLFSQFLGVRLPQGLLTIPGL